MRKALVTFDAVDTLWFRQGRPFEQTDEGLAEADSLFPPTPSTMYGAVAAAIARALLGASGDPVGREWNEEQSGSKDCFGLGDLIPGREGNGCLRTTGPLLLATGKAGGRHLWAPLPATLVSDGERFLNLKPRKTAKLASDLGKLDHAPAPEKPSRMLEEAFERFEPRPEWWLRWDKLLDYARDMDGAVDPLVAKNDTLQAGTHFPRERRIGLTHDPIAGAARESQLYAASHLRPKGAALAVQIERGGAWSLPERFLSSPLTLGGRGRAAFAHVYDSPLPVPETNLALDESKWVTDGGTLYARLIAVTPVPIDEKAPFGLPVVALAKTTLAEAKPLAAVLPKPVTVGLWRERAAPRLLRVFPAGAVWFVALPGARGLKKKEAATKAWSDAFALRLAAPELADMGLADMGFGAFIVGNWPMK